MRATSDTASENIDAPDARAPSPRPTPPTDGADSPHPLPALRTPLDDAAILQRLEHAARRGRLPGFERGGGGGLFRVAAFGTPFDHDLLATSEPDGEGRRVSFTIRVRPLMPALLALALVLTVEPGRYFLDAMIPGEWGWIDTRWWYYPLTILPIPFIWRAAFKRSRATSLAHAREQIDKVAGFIDAQPSA